MKEPHHPLAGIAGAPPRGAPQAADASTPRVTAEGSGPSASVEQVRDRAADRWVKVWDLPTRVFHWALVLLVVLGVVTGFLAPEWWMGAHVWSGYALLALMAFRFVWACLARNTAAW